jgi:hypothetical protein
VTAYSGKKHNWQQILWEKHDWQHILGKEYNWQQILREKYDCWHTAIVVIAEGRGMYYGY